MSTKKLQIVGSLGSDITIDSTLTQSGQAADAKVAGDAIRNLSALVGDTSVSDQISSAMEFATDDEIIAMLTELDAIPVLSDENGNIFTDETDTILLI